MLAQFFQWHLPNWVHLYKIARNLPLLGKLVRFKNRIHRFLQVNAQADYLPVAIRLLIISIVGSIRLAVDCSKVGFNGRVATISLPFMDEPALHLEDLFGSKRTSKSQGQYPIFETGSSSYLNAIDINMVLIVQ